MSKILFRSFSLFYFLLNVLSIQTYAGGTGSLRGFVTDSTNGEYVIYANVVVQGTVSGSPTDTRGYYFIPAVPVGRHTIIISHINYKTKYVTVDVKENKITQVDVILSPKNIELQGINIIGRNETKPTEVNLGLEKISIKELEMIPSGAEPDVFRALQTMSGVTTTGDVTSKYYVRGGGGDQNLVLFNGATIYNPFHAMGIFSVIDPEMISTVEFYKGGFNADYGGRISSILNIVTKDGNKNSYHATGSASLLSGKLAFEGPIPYGSFIVTGRKSYFSDILKKYLNGNSAPFDFYDLSFKVNYGNPNILQNGKFILYGFASGDAVKNDDPLLEDYTVKNNILGLTWNQVWSSPLFSVVNISYSGYRAELLPNLSQAKARLNNLNDVTADFNFTYVYDNKDEIDFGIQNKFLNLKLHQENLYNNITDFNQSGWDLTGFINYRYYRWEKLGVELGMRSKFLALSQGRPFIFEPRVNLTYRPIPLLAVKVSAGRYSQEVATLTTENDIISLFEPWIIIPDGIASPEASEFSIGLESYLSSELEIDLTAYYKYITNLLESNQTRYTLDANEFMNVNGKSYGLEFSTKFQNDLLYLKANYSLGWAYKMYGDVIYYPRYDIRHSVNILGGFNLGKGWEANATWSLRSGMPFTPIAGFYDRMPIDNVWSNYIFETYKAVVYWGEINSARLPFYHRLDLSLAKKFKIYLADVSLEASVLNVYNRNNIFYFDRDTGKKVYMLPFSFFKGGIMKRLFLIMFAAVPALLNLSCQEDFNPKTNFEKKYVLNCYINLDYDSYDTTKIYATVSELYDVDGLDPSQKKIKPFVSGAKIYFYYKGDKYLLNEYTSNAISKRPPPPSKYYYSAKLQRIYSNYPVSISAIMPDGTVLSSQTQLLEALQLGFSYDFIRRFTTRINRFLYGNAFIIFGGYTEGHLLFPKLSIPYYKTDGGYTQYYEEVPCTYVNRNGRYEPVYPSPVSGDSISYDYSAIDSTMAKIARSENFNNFDGTIIFQMVEMDVPLSKYYESIHGAIDAYSISLDQSVYSNIKGGLGIFGSKRTLSKVWILDLNYMHSFMQKNKLL